MEDCISDPESEDKTKWLGQCIKWSALVKKHWDEKHDDKNVDTCLVCQFVNNDLDYDDLN